MRLTIFNGSPRPGKNNTELLLNKFTDGFTMTPGNVHSVYKLEKMIDTLDIKKIVAGSEFILIAFPLYNYCMPAIVKEFIEALEPLKGTLKNIKIGYLVQYGFPEATHARALEKYLIKLTGILGADYLGTIIKGGCNNLIINSDRQNKKTYDGIKKIGTFFGRTGHLDQNLLSAFSAPENATFLRLIFTRLFAFFTNINYWGAELKKNGVFDEHFARPYDPQK